MTGKKLAVKCQVASRLVSKMRTIFLSNRQWMRNELIIVSLQLSEIAFTWLSLRLNVENLNCSRWLIKNLRYVRSNRSGKMKLFQSPSSFKIKLLTEPKAKRKRHDEKPFRQITTTNRWHFFSLFRGQTRDTCDSAQTAKRKLEIKLTSRSLHEHGIYVEHIECWKEKRSRVKPHSPHGTPLKWISLAFVSMNKKKFQNSKWAFYC